MYFNTNQESGDTLATSQATANRQEDVILALYKRAGRPLTPDHIERMVAGRWPITSIRRAVTVLTKAGLLRKLDETVEGRWGKRVHLWEAV